MFIGKYSRKVKWLWALSVSCMLIGVITTSFLSVIPFIVFVYVLFCENEREASVLLFSWIPFANIFKLTPSSTSLLTICELLLVVRHCVTRRVEIRFFLLLVSSAAYFMAFSVENFQFLTILKAIIAFYLVYYYVRNTSKEDIIEIAQLTSIGLFITMFLTMNQQYLSHIIPYLNDLDYVIDSEGHASDLMRMSGFIGDPNYCATMILMVVSLLCVLYYNKSIGNDFWLYSAGLLILGFFTYSKSFFLCVTVLVVLLILFVLIPKHKVWALLMIAGCVGFFVMVKAGYFMAVQTILQRFTQGTLLTGRADLNKDYIEYISNHTKVLFFGDGVTAERYVGARNNVHNMYIEIVYKLGIVGVMLYIMTLLDAFGVRFLHVKIRRSVAYVNYIPLLFFCVLFMFLAGVTCYALPFYYCIIYFGVCFQTLPSNKQIARGECND